MQGRNGGNVKLNIFQRTRLKYQNIRLDRKIKRIKKVHGVDIGKTDNIEVKTEFSSKKSFKNYMSEISKVIGRNNFRFTKVKSGASVKVETIKEIERVATEINKSYEQRKENIVSNAKKYLSKEVANAIERDLEELDRKKDRTRLSSGDYVDLIELNTEKIVDKIQSQSGAEEVLKNLTTNKFYDLETRDKQYRTNYKNAILKQYGDNSDTRELLEIIDNMDLDKFMLGLYNPYSNTQLPDIYDEEQIDGYIEYLVAHYQTLDRL